MLCLIALFFAEVAAFFRWEPTGSRDRMAEQQSNTYAGDDIDPRDYSGF
jgi:hypothetical protein